MIDKEALKERNLRAPQGKETANGTGENLDFETAALLRDEIRSWRN